MKQTHFFAAVVTAGMMCLSTFSVQGYAGTDNSKDVVETVIGDIDQNGVVDPADAIAILKINANENAYSENQIKVADVNADGALNVADVVLFQKWLLAVPGVKLDEGEMADLYEDGNLNVLDLAVMKQKLSIQ